MARKVSRQDNAFYGFERTVFWPLLDQINKTNVTTVQRFGTTWPVPREQQFRTMIEAQVCVDLLVSSVTFRELFPSQSARILVKESDTSDAYVKSGERVIYIPNHSATTDSPFMREAIIWHEIAHIVSGSTAHAKKFQDAYFRVIEAAHDAMFSKFVCILHMSAT